MPMESYKPNEEEIKEAEEMMGPHQKVASVRREMNGRLLKTLGVKGYLESIDGGRQSWES